MLHFVYSNAALVAESRPIPAILFQGRIQRVGLTVFQNLNSANWLPGTYMYRIGVRASHYKISPPLLITCTDWTDCTDIMYRQTVVPTHASLDHRRSCLPRRPLRESGTLFRWRLVAAVSAGVQATAEDCAVCPLLRLLTVVRVVIPSSDLQWCKQDQILKTKTETKITRPRPRPLLARPRPRPRPR